MYLCWPDILLRVGAFSILIPSWFEIPNSFRSDSISPKEHFSYVYNSLLWWLFLSDPRLVWRVNLYFNDVSKSSKSNNPIYLQLKNCRFKTILNIHVIAVKTRLCVLFKYELWHCLIQTKMFVVNSLLKKNSLIR